jgi:hypothetical protein
MAKDTTTVPRIPKNVNAISLTHHILPWLYPVFAVQHYPFHEGPPSTTKPPSEQRVFLNKQRNDLSTMLQSDGFPSEDFILSSPRDCWSLQRLSTMGWVPHPAQVSDPSAEPYPTLRLAADPGECPLWIRAYSTHGHPYLFGMVKNSGPSHKCHS